MKKEEFCELFGEIRQEYISEAVKPEKKKSLLWLKWGAAAACLCLVAVGLFCYKLEHPYPVREIAISHESDGPFADYSEIPRWEEQEIYRQYGTIPLNGTTYHAQKTVVPKEQVEKELVPVTAEGWDVYAEEAGEDANRYCGAVLYKISGLWEGCAVAVQYEGTEAYYSAVNDSYRPETLGQFLEDLDLKRNLVVNFAGYHMEKPISGQWAEIRFENIGKEKVMEMLLSAPEAKNVFSDSEWDDLPLISLSVSVPILGCENLSLGVYENGYLITNLLDTGKKFYIGEENTKAFLRYVFRECQGYEIAYVDFEQEIQGSRAEESESGESFPAECPSSESLAAE